MEKKLKLILFTLILILITGCKKNVTETKKETVKKSIKEETVKENVKKPKKEETVKESIKEETSKETINESKKEAEDKNEELKGIVTSEQNASVTKTYYYAIDNIVTKIEQITDADLSNYDSDTREHFKANIEPTKEKYSKINGLEYKIDLKDNKLHEVLIMHVKDPEILTNLIDNKFLAIKKGTTQIKLDEILDQHEEAGFNVERR